MRSRLFPILGALVVMAAGAQMQASASTNPDTPTPLKSNVVIGSVKNGQYPDHYFSFTAGPGTVKLRLTVHPGGNNGEMMHAILETPDGNSLLDVEQDSNGPFKVSSGTVDLSSSQTIVLHLSGDGNLSSATRATFRVQLDGPVALDKKAKPLHI